MSNPFDGADAVAIWKRAAPARAALVAATELMLDRAGVREGSRVLDVGAGAGDTSLLAARRVGPAGRVHVTDPSPEMIAAAREAVAAAGLQNLDFELAGAGEVRSHIFDAVIARNALQFVADLEGALVALRAVLQPGGRLAALVWPSAADDPWMGLPVSALRAIGKPPQPDDAVLLPMALGEGKRLPAALVAAGFSEVSIERVPVIRTFSDLEAARQAMVQGMHASLGAGGLSPEDRGSYSKELAAQVRVRPDGDGVALDCGCLLASGTA